MRNFLFSITLDQQQGNKGLSLSCLISLSFILYLLISFKVEESQSLTYDPLRPVLTLYQNSFNKGAYFAQGVGNRCYNLPHSFDNWASSLSTHSKCVIVCSKKDCKGRCLRMFSGSRGHSDLRQVRMDNDISSFKPCKTKTH